MTDYAMFNNIRQQGFIMSRRFHMFGRGILLLGDQSLRLAHREDLR